MSTDVFFCLTLSKADGKYSKLLELLVSYGYTSINRGVLYRLIGTPPAYHRQPEHIASQLALKQSVLYTRFKASKVGRSSVGRVYLDASHLWIFTYIFLCDIYNPSREVYKLLDEKTCRRVAELVGIPLLRHSADHPAVKSLAEIRNTHDFPSLLMDLYETIVKRLIPHEGHPPFRQFLLQVQSKQIGLKELNAIYTILRRQKSYGEWIKAIVTVIVKYRDPNINWAARLHNHGILSLFKV